MSKKDGLSDIEESQSIQNDAFAAFDAALGSLKEEKIQLRTRREHVAKVKEAAEKNVATFEGLIASGTYEDLVNFPFALFVNSLGVELNQQLMPDLDKQMKIVADAKERRKKYNQLPDKDKEKLKPMVEAVTLLAVEAMKSILKQLAVGFAELRERQRLELETTEEEARAILDSPIFDSEVRIEEESYEDYKERVVRELVEPFCQAAKKEIENKFWADISEGQKEGELISFIALKIRDGRFTSQEALQKYQAMRKDISEQLAAGTFVSEIDIDDLVQRYFGTNRCTDLQWTQAKADFANGKDSYGKTFEVLKNILKEEAVIQAGIKSFAEERVKMAIETIERECETEEDRKNALEFMKTKLPKWNSRCHIGKDIREHLGDRTKLELMFQMPEHEFASPDEVPHWLWEASRRYNEIRIFENMILMRKGGSDLLMKYLTTDQILRQLCGENAYNEGKKDEETPAFDKGPGYCSLNYFFKNLTIGQEWPRMTIDDDLISRGMGLVERLGDIAGRTFYSRDEETALAHFGNLMNHNFERKRFRFYPGSADKPKVGELELKNAERKKQQAWIEKVSADSAELKPVGEEEVARIIAENGYCPIRTLPEAVRIIDALKSKILVTLQRELAAKAEIDPEKQRAESAQRAAESAEEAVKKMTRELGNEIKSLRGQLRVAEEEMEKAKNEVTWAKDAGEDRIRNVKSSLRDLQAKITRELSNIGEISGLFGAEGKKREAMEALIREIQKKLESI